MELLNKSLGVTNGLPLIGQTLGNFRIVAEIGKGGMGIVYKAYDQPLERVVALKVLLPHLANEEFIKRFTREAQIAAKLDHPNIVQIYGVGHSGNLWYIAMQYIKGKTLTQYLQEKFRFTLQDALLIIRATAEALSKAHRVGILHRDMKPSNIMIDEAGQVKIMDFGLSRSIVSLQQLTEPGIYLGTPEYSSPEQCESTAVDERSDIYSLGVVLYEILSGRVPYVAESPLTLFKKIMEEPPLSLSQLNPSIPHCIVKLVDKMIAKDKAERYQSCGELIQEIDRIISTESLPQLSGMQSLSLAQPVRYTPISPIKPVKRPVVILNKKMVPVTLITISVCIVLMTFLLIRLAQKPEEESLAPSVPPPKPATPEVSTPPPAQAEELNLVVFDFHNLSDDPEVKWMEVGIPDILIANLAQVRGLKVVNRESLIRELQRFGYYLARDLIETDRIKLVPETEDLLRYFKADVVLQGSFYVAKDKRFRVMVKIYLYATNQIPALQYITTCQVEGSDYEQDLFEVVDRLSLKLVDLIKELGPKFNLPAVLKIACLEEPMMGRNLVNWLTSKLSESLTEAEGSENITRSQDKLLQLKEQKDAEVPAKKKEPLEVSDLDKIQQMAESGKTSKEDMVCDHNQWVQKFLNEQKFKIWVSVPQQAQSQSKDTPEIKVFLQLKGFYEDLQKKEEIRFKK